jgi:hypothetical protein
MMSKPPEVQPRRPGPKSSGRCSTPWAAVTNRRLAIPARTVRDYVDPHACRLVDAINSSVLSARTLTCCSGHYHKPSLPYIAFRCWGWDFVGFLLTSITAVNRVTRGQTSISLRELHSDRLVRGTITLTVYPWWHAGLDLRPLFVDEVRPPRSLVQLWWRELDELAAMVEERRTWPSREFVAFFDERWERSFNGRRGRVPVWARRPQALGD